ncbi:Uncharacterized protein TXXE_19020 [Thermobacillus xylanilyticus]|uniref:Uncharacterized protein n=1 Tax=Thermobacillus xylanilyticus TaxID=76633 RepID=A0ABN7S5L0_THEXY|nr:hypothetical protein [Thermobacillus xylanilyticus]CAG5092892.1 Uncharacterized protein TXXE_19020 [Thermobacillus xylanilyticus]
MGRGLNQEVTAFLDGIDHPMRAEIDRLRSIMMSAGAGLSEGINMERAELQH